ncbi:MAG: hypothetical protein ABI670_15825 [Chloroflexota bacterium]
MVEYSSNAALLYGGGYPQPSALDIFPFAQHKMRPAHDYYNFAV